MTVVQKLGHCQNRNVKSAIGKQMNGKILLRKEAR